MTMEEQDAAIGRAHKELKAQKEKLKALMLAAYNLGKQFEELGRGLQHCPQAIGINCESQFPINLVPPGTARTFERKIFDAEKFGALTQEVRDTMQEIATLEQKLA